MTRRELFARAGALALAAAFAATPLAYADYTDAIDQKQQEYYYGSWYPHYPNRPNQTPTDIIVPPHPIYPLPDKPDYGDYYALYVNGSLVSQSPYYESSVLMLPLRVIAEKGGYTVSYHSGAVTLKKSGKTIRLTIGRNSYPNGSRTERLETAPVVKNGVTYVPKSFVSGILGYKVSSSAYGRFSVTTTSSNNNTSTYRVYVDGERAGTAHYSGSTLMLPLRSVGRALGWRYSYSSKSRYSTLTSGSERLRVYWDENSYPVNGRQVKLERKPQLRDGTVYVPASFVTRALDCGLSITASGKVVIK